MNIKIKNIPSIYYIGRYLGYECLFFPVSVALGIFVKIVAESSEISDFIAIVFLFSTVLYLLLVFLWMHFELKRVFFKPYKHIRLNPKFKKITYCFTTKLFLLMMCARTPVTVYGLLCDYDVVIPQPTLNLFLSVFGLAARFVIFYFVVKRNADVVAIDSLNN